MNASGPTNPFSQTPISEQAQARPVLEYRTPPPPKVGAFGQWLKRMGPWWVRPSWLSMVLVVLVAGSLYPLRHQPMPWIPGITASMSTTSGGSYSGVDAFCPMPGRDAVFCIDSTGAACVWRPWDNRRLLSLPPLAAPAGSVAVSADQSRLLVESSTGQWSVFDSDTGQLIRQLVGGLHPYLPFTDPNDPWIKAIAISAEGSHAATLTQSGLVTLWDITGPSAKLLAQRPGAEAIFPVRDPIEFSPDDKHLLVYPRSGVLSVLDASTLVTQLFPAVGDSREAKPFRWMNGGKQLVVTANTGSDSTVEIYDCESGKLLRRFHYDGYFNTSMVVAPDSSRILLTSQMGHGALCIDNPLSEHPVIYHTFPANLPEWCSPAFFPDGKRLVTYSGWDTEPVIVDVTQQSHLATLPLPKPAMGSWNPMPPMVGAVVSRDGDHVAVLMSTGLVQVYNHTGKESRWGLLASPLLALTGVVLLGATLSLWRDAGRQAVETGPMFAPLGMVMIGFIPLLLTIAMLATAPAEHLDWQVQRELPLIWLSLLVPLGIAARSASQFWTTISGVLLIICAFGFGLAFTAAQSLSESPFQILDRAIAISKSQIELLTGLGFLATVIVFRQLVAERRRSQMVVLPLAS